MKKDTESVNYTTIRNIISESSGPFNAASIRNSIWQSVGQGNSQDYIDTIIHFFNVAIRNGDTDAKSMFKNVFCEDILEHRGFFETTGIAMQLEGLHDLILIDIRSKRTTDEDEYSIGYEPLLQKMKEAFYHASFDIPLLIVGETGTSKELLARTIHALSYRRKKSFQEINCAAIPESLFEAELFGVIANYPGFHNSKGLTGKVVQADTGILFLDELGKMDKQLQAKLLKVIEEQTVIPLGGETPVPINVRFIAAAQPGDLENIIPDLKYRFGYPDIIKMPTLNDRLEEIGAFVIDHTIAGVNRKMGLEDGRISIAETVKTILLNRQYEGNYRELENILRGALISALGDNREEILPEDVLSVIEVIELSPDDERNIIQSEIEHGKVGIADILDYADKVKASIVEDKFVAFLKGGTDLKSVFLAEGKTESDYQTFLKKVKQITGKGVRDFNKMSLSS